MTGHNKTTNRERQLMLPLVDDVAEVFPTKPCVRCGRTGWRIEADGLVCLTCERNATAKRVAMHTRCRTADEMTPMPPQTPTMKERQPVLPRAAVVRGTNDEKNLPGGYAGSNAKKRFSFYRPPHVLN